MLNFHFKLRRFSQTLNFHSNFYVLVVQIFFNLVFAVSLVGSPNSTPLASTVRKYVYISLCFLSSLEQLGISNLTDVATNQLVLMTCS